MALENVRKSIYRTDTAPVYNQPDYAGMYERQAIQMRQEKKYGQQITRQRTQDWDELTKMSLDSTITDGALKEYEMSNYNRYMDKVKKLAATRDGALTNEDIVNIRGAQGMVLQAQAQARDAQARWSAAGKTMADPRNEGLYDIDYYNKATKDMREWFRTGGESGEIPKSFTDFSAEQAVPYFTATGDDLEKKSYEYKTQEGGKDITRGYEQATITKEQAQDIIRREMEGSHRLRKGVIEDWQRLDPNQEYKTYEEFAMNNDEYLDAILGPRAELYKEQTSTEATPTGGPGSENFISYNAAEGAHLLGSVDKGEGFRIKNVVETLTTKTPIGDPREAVLNDNFDIKEERINLSGGAVIRVNPEDNWADIALPKELEIDRGFLEGYMEGVNILFSEPSQQKDKVKLKVIRIPFDKVSTLFKDKGYTFEGWDWDQKDKDKGGKYLLPDYTK